MSLEGGGSRCGVVPLWIVRLSDDVLATTLHTHVLSACCWSPTHPDMPPHAAPCRSSYCSPFTPSHQPQHAAREPELRAGARLARHLLRQVRGRLPLPRLPHAAAVQGVEGRSAGALPTRVPGASHPPVQLLSARPHAARSYGLCARPHTQLASGHPRAAPRSLQASGETRRESVACRRRSPSAG